MPGEHKVHPYLHLEILCRGSVNILYSPLFWIPLFFAILGQAPSMSPFFTMHELYLKTIKHWPDQIWWIPG